MRKTIRNFSLKNIKSRIVQFTNTEMKFNPHTRVKTEISHKKNSTQYENNFIVTKRAQLYEKQKKKEREKQKRVTRTKQNENSSNNFSNFQRLKLHAQQLQNSQFLRQNPQTQTMKNQPEYPLSENHYNHEYVINNQFISSKKVSLMDRYRNNIKKLNTKRKHISSMNNHELQFQSSLNFKRISTQSSNLAQKPVQNRRKKSSFGAKKFYNRPTAKNHYKSQSLIEPNLKTKAMQINHKGQIKNKQIVIVCL